jgi:hypothetical protein
MRKYLVYTVIAFLAVVDILLLVQPKWYVGVRVFEYQWRAETPIEEQQWISHQSDSYPPAGARAISGHEDRTHCNDQDDCTPRTYYTYEILEWVEIYHVDDKGNDQNVYYPVVSSVPAGQRVNTEATRFYFIVRFLDIDNNIYDYKPGTLGEFRNFDAAHTYTLAINVFQGILKVE